MPLLSWWSLYKFCLILLNQAPYFLYKLGREAALFLLIGDPDGVAGADGVEEEHCDAERPPLIPYKVIVSEGRIVGPALDNALGPLFCGDKVLFEGTIRNADSRVFLNVSKIHHAMAK